MGVDSTHPSYDAFVPDWEQLEDCYEGERTVKLAGTKYLPATSGMVLDKMTSPTDKGFLAYDAYRKRAVFPELVKSAVEGMIGVMHQKEPVIELPAALEPLRDLATLRKESLTMLLRRINELQLRKGRLGLMLDVIPGTGPTLPYIAIYDAVDIINWGETARPDGTSLDKLNLVALDESGPQRMSDGFGWEEKRRYRVLVLGNPTEAAPVDPANPTAPPPPLNVPFRVAVFEDGHLEYDDAKAIAPSIQGRTLNEIPFVFANSKDIVPEPDEAPLIGLSNIALTIYRGEADFRQALFMQGQDTLVVQGGTDGESYRTGANSCITPPVGGDAKFIGVQSQGLPSMAAALEADYARGAAKAGELINETSRDAESGDALRTRVAARTATLKQIALAGATALQEILRMAARWIGANEDEVVVTPNLDFVDEQMEGTDLVALMNAKGLGAPLSLATIHERMQERGMTQKTWDEEMQAIEDEKALELVPPTTTSSEGPADVPGKTVETRTTQRTGFPAADPAGAKGAKPKPKAGAKAGG